MTTWHMEIQRTNSALYKNIYKSIPLFSKEDAFNFSLFSAARIPDIITTVKLFHSPAMSEINPLIGHFLEHTSYIGVGAVGAVEALGLTLALGSLLLVNFNNSERAKQRHTLFMRLATAEGVFAGISNLLMSNFH